MTDRFSLRSSMHIDLLRRAAQFEEKCQDPGKLPSPFLAHDSLISC